MLECSTAHHHFMLTIIVNDTTNIIPNVFKMFFIPRRLFFTVVICIMIDIAKLNKITKFPTMFKVCIIQQCPGGIPHHVQFF